MYSFIQFSWQLATYWAVVPGQYSVVSYGVLGLDLELSQALHGMALLTFAPSLGHANIVIDRAGTRQRTARGY
jgi:hypothetical protein